MSDPYVESQKVRTFSTEMSKAIKKDIKKYKNEQIVQTMEENKT